MNNFTQEQIDTLNRRIAVEIEGWGGDNGKFWHPTWGGYINPNPPPYNSSHADLHRVIDSMDVHDKRMVVRAFSKAQHAKNYTTPIINDMYSAVAQYLTASKINKDNDH